MTKKMTITLEDSLIDELNDFASIKGKKKAQIIREALQLYFNSSDIEQKQKSWEKNNKEAIEEYNKMIEEEGLILKESRMF